MKTLKVIVGGEGNVGKTSLIRQYARNRFSEARNITLGIDITSHEFLVDGESLRLAIWDIEGQAGNRPNFYIGAQAGLLIYDVTEPASLQAIVAWHQRCRRFAPNARLILLGNKVDLGLVFPPIWGRVLARYLGARHGFVSAKTGENVAQAFDLLARAAGAQAQMQAQVRNQSSS